MDNTRLSLGATTAGSLLNLAGARPTPVMLDDAGRALKVAWALDPGAESMRAMWRRLNLLRETDGRGT